MRIRFAAVFIAGILMGLFMGGFLFSGLFMEKIEQTDLSGIPQLSLEGFSQVNISIEPMTVHLTSGCRKLSMVIGIHQSDSITEGLSGNLGFRPTSHDTLQDIMENFGMDVIMVKVDDFRNSTYFAKLLVMQGNDILNLDTRPSDAIAIAVRSMAPVYVKDSLLNEHGKNVCENGG